MKNKIKILGVILAFFSPVITNAQVNTEVLKKYPAQTISRLQSVLNRVNLSSEKQEKLANYFNQQNNNAELRLKQGASSQEISSYYTLDTKQLAKILSPLELNDFNTSDQTKYRSELVKAIRFRQQLALSIPQTNTLLQEISKETAPEVEDIQKFKKIEFDKLKQVLNESQFKNYFMVASQDSALRTIKTYFRQLKKYNLVKVSDSSKLCDELLKYTLNQFADLEKTRNYNPDGMDSVSLYHTLYRPYILWKLDVYNNTLPWWVWNQGGRIVINRKKLNISDIQVDSLLMNNIALEKKKWANKSRYSNEFINVWSEQVASIIRTLNESQYNQYLELKFYRQSLYNADQDWAGLKNAGLVNAQTDSAKVMTENTSYELKALVANEKAYYTQKQKDLFAKQAVENMKPELLKRLDAIRNENANNQRTKSSLAW
ncbi:hypothetical protein [Pedobacter mendelii]|uniref:Uncharacterized protein n=1 Tax=Pedobacter mendelii TaxID=1908240 RepID=A0ABQ2BIT6_9SPHI|nr:hypothetical protein [Pedobacter mendelii]GGI25222.1 hypothetical protein GCM10008119_16580 [Pedobacter mendelii]